MSDKLLLILTCKFINFTLVGIDSATKVLSARCTTIVNRQATFSPIREFSEAATQTSPIFTITTPPIESPREIMPTPRRLQAPVQVIAGPSPIPVHYHAHSPEPPESSSTAIITTLIITALAYKYLR